MIFRVVLVGALAVGGMAPVQAQSLFGDPGRSHSLYQDRTPERASRVGDILTVLVAENTTATNQSELSTSKDNQVDIDSKAGTGPLRFIPGFGLTSDASNKYSGQGATSRRQQIQARISVTVVGLKPNGDLLVEGSRTIEINGEREVIHISGSVNPLIIPADNTIQSHRIADLQVSYKGKGAISQGARPGVFVRLLNWIF